MPGSYAHAVAVSAARDDLEVGVGQLDPGGERQGPAVERVDSVGVEEVGRLAGAPDARDHRQAARVDVHLGQRHLHGAEDAKVSAAGAPVVVEVALQVCELKCHLSTPLCSGPYLRRSA